MIEFYLYLKSLLESILLGPGIFWLLFIVYLRWVRSSNIKRKTFALRAPLISLCLLLVLVSPPFLEIVSLPLYGLTPGNLSANLPAAPGRVEKADAIVVLGGGVDDLGCPTDFSTRRAYIGSKLFLEGKAPWLILSTGQTNKEINQTEAKAMEMVALGAGVMKERILLEEKSYNTITNANQTYNLLKNSRIKSIILVTSSHHLYRATGVFKKNIPGMTIIPYGTEEMKLFKGMIAWGRIGQLNLILHEYGAIFIYKIKGWI